VETFKHDFFAATGLYRGPDGLAVLKIGRCNDLATVPMTWLARWLTSHEAALYRELQGTPGIPRFIGTVCQGAGFLHAFVPGHPLGRYERVSDALFDELFDLVRTIHARHIAYVDLNKRQNILVGEDGRPYLIDFQISLHLPPGSWRGLPPVQWLLRRFQHGDWYHCHKHKRRLRPDLLTEQEQRSVSELSVWIRLHRWFSRPVTHLRRRALKRLAKSEQAVVAGSGSK
jgi:hypothetical protein